MKKTLLSVVVSTIFYSCTDDFEKIKQAKDGELSGKQKDSYVDYIRTPIDTSQLSPEFAFVKKLYNSNNKGARYMEDYTNTTEIWYDDTPFSNIELTGTSPNYTTYLGNYLIVHPKKGISTMQGGVPVFPALLDARMADHWAEFDVAQSNYLQNWKNNINSSSSEFKNMFATLLGVPSTYKGIFLGGSSGGSQYHNMVYLTPPVHRYDFNPSVLKVGIKILTNKAPNHPLLGMTPWEIDTEGRYTFNVAVSKSLGFQVGHSYCITELIAKRSLYKTVNNQLVLKSSSELEFDIYSDIYEELYFGQGFYKSNVQDLSSNEQGQLVTYVKNLLASTFDFNERERLIQHYTLFVTLFPYQYRYHRLMIRNSYVNGNKLKISFGFYETRHKVKAHKKYNPYNSTWESGGEYRLPAYQEKQHVNAIDMNLINLNAEFIERPEWSKSNFEYEKM